MDAINIFVHLKKMASNVVRNVISSWIIVGSIEIIKRNNIFVK
jgi:hypothetical protein